MSRVSIPAGLVKERQRNQPNGFAGLDANGTLPAVVRLRQGEAAALDEIVLADGELAIERTAGGDPAWLRIGNGATSGGVDFPGRSLVLNSVLPEPAAGDTYEDVPGFAFELTGGPGGALRIYRLHYSCIGRLDTNAQHLQDTGQWQGIGIRLVGDTDPIGVEFLRIMGTVQISGSAGYAAQSPNMTEPQVLPFPFDDLGTWGIEYEAFGNFAQLHFNLTAHVDGPTPLKWQFAKLNPNPPDVGMWATTHAARVELIG